MLNDPRLSQPQHELLVEKDVEIVVRDGTRLKADVFRPAGEGRFPVLINQGPYQKDKVWVPPPDLDEPANEYMNWETVNPTWWVPRGYALVRVDARGSGKSPGQLAPVSVQEIGDFYDAIEWAGAQPWSTGKVGTIGISYFAISQWFVANLQPPSLKAMVPWEGAADRFRDNSYHGGLLSIGFMMTWYSTHLAHHILGRAGQEQPDRFREHFLLRMIGNGLDSEAYKSMQAQWDRITLPMLTAGNWGGMGLHLRGNTEAFMRAASPHKWMRIHTGTHYHPFYSDDGREQQLRFLDHWLKGIDNGLLDEPRVKLAIRTGGGQSYWRDENEWPLARTQWTRYHLDTGTVGSDGQGGTLRREPPAAEASRAYSSTGGTRAGSASASSTSLASGPQHFMGLSFTTEPFVEDTEVTGPLAAVLHVSSESEDMDLFLTIRNIDAQGKDVWETGQQGQPVPVAKGWLRVSHRELDPELSRPYRPYHKHRTRRYLKPGEVVRVEVEIWPTSMVFKAGHRLRLDVQPRDGVGSAPFTHYHADYNVGMNSVHTGPRHESYLLLPLIPPK